MPGDVALYIHVPFCRRKCPYCSFVSCVGREGDIPRYLSALGQEMARRASGKSISSIYFGGGTPSLLSPEQLGGLLESIREMCKVSDTAEITLEANPGTVDTARLTALRGLGINRLSLGVQSLDDRELKMLGRIHTADEAREAIKSARAAGFTNLSLDFIYGLPGQTPKDWRQTLEAAVALQPEHISLYGLTLENDTPLARAVREGSLPEPEPDAAADQYELAEDMLAAAGYVHYELSNWARPGRESRHNLAYWQNRPYIGAGVAAHSCVDGHRLANTKSLDAYLDGPPEPETDEAIGPALELAETVILGLRLNAGINAAQIRNRHGADILELYRQPILEMAAAGLLERHGDNLKLTRRGRLLSNEVFWRFLPE